MIPNAIYGAILTGTVGTIAGNSLAAIGALPSAAALGALVALLLGVGGIVAIRFVSREPAALSAKPIRGKAAAPPHPAYRHAA